MGYCTWADMNELNRVYHDAEWGIPVHDDRQMFEHLTLYLDAAFSDGLIGIHPNDNTATVWMKASDLVRILEERGTVVKIVEIQGLCYTHKIYH